MFPLPWRAVDDGALATFGLAATTADDDLSTTATGDGVAGTTADDDPTPPTFERPHWLSPFFPRKG